MLEIRYYNIETILLLLLVIVTGNSKTISFHNLDTMKKSQRRTNPIIVVKNHPYITPSALLRMV